MIGKRNIKRRMRNVLLIVVVVFAILIARVFYIQIFDGKRLSKLAYEQQSSDRKINPKRGTIYDATEKNILAISGNVEIVTVNPTNIKEKEKVAKELSELFNLNYEETLRKVNKQTSIVTIARKVEKDRANELRNWMEENNIVDGINIDEDTKRYYPYNNLASQVIGFCGSDNQGLNGVEAKYDNILKGKIGTISKVTDASGRKIDNENEVYNTPQNGDDIVLTIDVNIQGIAEKFLKEACIDNKCEGGGNVVIMSPKTGDILAMAGYPNYNLNEPFKVNLSDQELNFLKLGEESKEKMQGNEKENKNENGNGNDITYDNGKTKNTSNDYQYLWRNKAISDTYEPGSTFKIVTASTAVNENIAEPDKKGAFNCIGYIDVAGVKMKCWRYYKPHGSESLREALMNSCNPVFIGLGEKIGVKKYYEYLSKFGFFKKTGIDLPGEANSIFLKENKVGPVELGTISFGQRFEITPIQMCTMLSSIGNNGRYIKPRLVKKIIHKNQDNDIDNNAKESNVSKKGGNAKDENNVTITEIEKVEGEQIISEETAKSVLSMMQSVVDSGTGKKAKIEGINIGGKTGTSEDGVNTGKYIASFIGIGPIEDPKAVCLVVLYNPKGESGHSGGTVAAPVAGKILKEVLEYIE